MYLSLGNSKDIVSFKEALFKGLAQTRAFIFQLKSISWVVIFGKI